MNIERVRQLRSELSELDSLLSKIPEEQVIDRMSLEGRRNRVVEALQGYEGVRTNIRPTLLTFKGSPVKERRGIFADFGSAIVGAFNSAIVAMGASASQELGSRGAIRNAEDFGLMITDVARGSFGFQLERASDQLVLVPDTDPVSAAIDRVITVIEATTLSDDELVAALAETDRRALGRIKDFLDTLVEHEATCAIKSDQNEFRFNDVDQVERSSSRLRDDNVIERDSIFGGKFIGYLPQSRDAEYLVNEINNEDAEFLGEIIGIVIKGKVDQTVPNADAINGFLGQTTSATVRVRRVGDSNPSFTFTGFEAS